MEPSPFQVAVSTSAAFSTEEERRRWIVDVFLTFSSLGRIRDASHPGSNPLFVTHSSSAPVTSALRLSNTALHDHPIVVMPSPLRPAAGPPNPAFVGPARFLVAKDDPSLYSDLDCVRYAFVLGGKPAAYLEFADGADFTKLCADAAARSKVTQLTQHKNTVYVIVPGFSRDFLSLMRQFGAFGVIEEASSLMPLTASDFRMTIVYADSRGFHRAMVGAGRAGFNIRPLLDGESKCDKSPYKLRPFFPDDVVGVRDSGICARLDRSDFRVTASSVKLGRPENVFNSRKPLFFSTQPDEGAWVAVRFLNSHAYLSGVVVRSAPLRQGRPHLRAFVVEGSADGANFFVLADITDAVELDRPGGVLVCDFGVEAQPFEIVRIRQTAANWGGTNELCVCSIDFLGRLEAFATFVRRQQEQDIVAAKTRVRQLEDRLAGEEQRQKQKEMRRIKLAASRAEKRRRMSAQRGRFDELLYFQFCECFELSLRTAAPKMSETDVEWTLHTMFADMPDWMKPQFST
jgi:hypothetical protein